MMEINENAGEIQLGPNERIDLPDRCLAYRDKFSGYLGCVYSPINGGRVYLGLSTNRKQIAEWALEAVENDLHA